MRASQNELSIPQGCDAESWGYSFPELQDNFKNTGCWLRGLIPFNGCQNILLKLRCIQKRDHTVYSWNM